ncbi:MAG: acetyltransferase [Clostridia bacterium]|nr:acetyltransferase [Clostridia bacterium]
MLIIGAGGHGKVVADIAIEAGYEVMGFIDDNIKKAPLPDLKVLGSINVIPSIFSQVSNVRFILAIGDNATRRRIASSLSVDDKSFAVVCHPFTSVSKFANINSGTVIMPGAVINAGAYVGKHVIINTACSIDHDCNIGDYVHISPGAHLAGNVTVEEGTHIGTGAAVIPGCKIGKWSVIGAGAVVIEDIPPGVIAVGVPAKPIKKL